MRKRDEQDYHGRTLRATAKVETPWKPGTDEYSAPSAQPATIRDDQLAVGGAFRLVRGSSALHL